jgi:hypothetical protein
MRSSRGRACKSSCERPRSSARARMRGSIAAEARRCSIAWPAGPEDSLGAEGKATTTRGWVSDGRSAPDPGRCRGSDPHDGGCLLHRPAINALVRSDLALCRQKRPLLRQQFLKRLEDPQGHKSLLPRRSTSSTSPSLIVRGPRFTRVSDGKPLRRLLIGSKGEPVFWICRFSWHGCLLAVVVCCASRTSRRQRRKGLHRLRLLPAVQRICCVAVTRLELVDLSTPRAAEAAAGLWIGAVGYEHHRDHIELARHVFAASSGSS